MKTYKHSFFIKFIKIIIIITTIFFCIIMTTGCKNSYSKLFSYSVISIPKNLDPQTACNSDEISIINSIFEGLYKQNPNKTYSLAAASNVESNNDKTQFLFSIKTNRSWFLNSTNNSEKQTFEKSVKADDFEFAFKRLFNPSTNSPFAQNYYFIKNAQAVHEGKLNIEKLGVKATNNKLLIELEHPVPNLEEMLSMTPTMPCCEQFFKHTKGRYGLNMNTIMCCGKFYVHMWPQSQKDKKLRLRLNPKHPESKNVKILGVNLSQRPQQHALKLIKKNEIDSAFFDTTETDLSNIGLNNSIPFQNSTCGIIFNHKSDLFQNEKIRQALALTINRDQIKQNLNPKKSTIAQGIIPNSVTIFGQNFQNLKNNTPNYPEFNPEKAKQLFNEGINELKHKANPQPKNKNKHKKASEKTDSVNLNKFSILINENQYAIINEILQNWQQTLNLFLKTEICDNETYLKNLKNQNFDCTLITLENEFNSPSYILNKFLPNSPFNVANVNLPNLKPILNAASKSTTLSDMVSNFEQAEQEILNSASFIPIHHPIKTFIYNKNFRNVNLIGGCKQLLFDHISPKQ